MCSSHSEGSTSLLVLYDKVLSVNLLGLSWGFRDTRLVFLCVHVPFKGHEISFVSKGMGGRGVSVVFDRQFVVNV